MLRRLAALVLAVGLGACALDGASQSESGAESLDGPASARVLALVNYPGTDVEVLDVKVGLDKRAAQQIVQRRDGADGMPVTGDDKPFATIADLDAVPYVGAASLSKLDAYAIAHPPPASETVEGVPFLGWQVEAVVWGVNGAKDATELKSNLGLTISAASSLIAARPFSTVAQIGAAKYIGSSALFMLRNYAMQWWHALHYTCATSFWTRAVPDVDAYGSDIRVYDTRDEAYKYQTGARGVPACVLPTLIESDLRTQLLDFAGWTQTAKDFPENMQYGALTKGPTVFRTFLDATLAHMDEIRQDRIGQGDTTAQASYDALKKDYDKVAYITEMHAMGTYSMQIRIEASECSETAVLFIDPAQGIVVMMHQPPQC